MLNSILIKLGLIEEKPFYDLFKSYVKARDKWIQKHPGYLDTSKITFLDTRTGEEVKFDKLSK